MRSRAKKHVPDAPLPKGEAEGPRVLETIVLIGVYGALLAPLIYSRTTLFPFIYPKALYLQLVVGVTFPAWVVLALRDKRYRPQRSSLFWAVVAWMGSITMAGLLGANPWRSWFSYPERMMGVLTQLHFFAWYLMASSMFRTVSGWRRLLQTHLAVGLVSAVVALLQVAYPTLIGGAEIGRGERVAGLIGNPIYFGAYEAFSIYFVVLLWRKEEGRRLGLYAAVALAALLAVVFAGSRGPMLGLLVGLVAAVLSLGATGRHLRLVKASVLALATLGAAYLVTLVFLVDRPFMQPFWQSRPGLLHLFTMAEPARLKLWAAAWDGFLERPFLGWGPANYELAFDQVFRPSFHFIERMGRIDEAHNNLLNVLCETGAVGASAFLAVWVVLAVAVFRAMRRQTVTPMQGAALVGAAVGHFAQNLFAFDSPATELVAFMVLGLATSATREQSGACKVYVQTADKRRAWAGVPVICLLGIPLFASVLPFLSSHYGKRAVDDLNLNDGTNAFALFSRALRFPTPYHEEQLAVASGMVLGLAKADRLKTWANAEALVALTIQLGDAYLAQNPHHTPLGNQLANTFVAIGRIYQPTEMNKRAESLYLAAIADSPRRAGAYLAYAEFLAPNGRPVEAEREYRKALELDPDGGDTDWMLGRFLWRDLQRADEGATLMARSNGLGEYGRYIPSSSLEWIQLSQALARVRKTKELKALANVLQTLPPQSLSSNALLEISKLMANLGLAEERAALLSVIARREAGGQR
jgi:O-antigen ligase/Tfp pilus assembly protein PilF